jgi:assimilatory nitrate reductase catalytic subunit
MSDAVVTRTTCPYCGVGCGLVVSARAALQPAPIDPTALEVRADPDNPSNFGRICLKGATLADTLGLENRLLHPEIGARRASWDEALETVARGFAEAIATHGPDAVAFYVSGQLLTEDYYVANKLMKGFIGSANIDTNSRLCMASAVAGHKRAFGADVVPPAYADIEQAELFVIVGANMAWCHPVLFQRIAEAKRANETARIVVVDPRRTATCDAANLVLPIRPGTDAMLFNGLLSYIGRADALDWAYLDAHTEGVGAAMAAARETAPSVPAVAQACGLEEEAVAQFYRWFCGTPRTLTFFSQGVNQSSSGTDKVNAIINAHLATGRVGKPGAGPFSLTGQSNAMGGREVGGLANQLAAHMDFTPENVARVAGFWRAPRIAKRPGLKAVELFEALDRRAIKALWVMCTNPAVSMPNADMVERALRGCELVVVSDCTRTDTTACADVLLPAAAWGEKSGTVTSSERRISRQRAFLAPAGESRPDWWIVTEVARRMGFEAAFPYRSPADIFREHAALSALENGGDRAFDIGALARLSDEQYDALEPARWPAPAAGAAQKDALARVQRPGGALFRDGNFFTATGKARLVPIRPRRPMSLPDERHPLILNTGRTRDQWHTMTRTGKSARLSAYRPEPFVQVNPLDARRFAVATGQLAELRHDDACMLARVEVTDEVQPGQVFAPMHWSAPFAKDARVGVLLAALTDPLSGQPELKHGAVSLSAYRPAWHGFVLSRRPISVHFEGCAYCVRAIGKAHVRYELAGDRAPASWPGWARAALGEGGERGGRAEGGERGGRAESGERRDPAENAEHRKRRERGEWIELHDPAAGRYRAALVVGRELDACVFIARGVEALPDRARLAGMIDGETIDTSARLALLAGAPR